MIAAFIRHLMIATLIVLLHAPLAYQASTLHADLAPGMGLQDLSLVSQLSLLLLLALPYAALALFGIRWNPPRARLGEYDC
ncbi:MAG: hypothetical protein KDI22_06300 [Gammaproteobacteria bacterium]|nr:hypothetical protein [Gammaproteobacteria bacterium]MCP5316733.1 hypothetical protein [Chromatiaceae bacterium]MCW5587932.1 hypothetical protein [Chromatiales bacterium]MCB1818751.1 hypothetical protein [Gammaproteobacteria bacterium]MCP5436091.1 hypothetical protein [Chromatiaceae bacterium]